MSATCQFEAPNKQPSKLYDDVYNLHGKDAAKRVWAYVRTEDFKTFFGDWQRDRANSSNAVDNNGEPKVMSGGFLDTRSGKLLPLLSLTDNLSTLAQARINVINKLKGIENRYKNSDRPGGVEKITQLKEQLLSQADEDKIALLRFIQFASKQAESAYASLLRLEAKLADSNRNPDEKKGDLRQLSRVTEYLSSFELVNEVAAALDGQSYKTNAFGEGVVDKNFINQWIAPILYNIEQSKLKYNKLAKPLVADFLLTYNTNANLDRAKLIEQLTTMHEDVSIFQRWGNSLADSGDSVLALVNRAISDVRNRTHQSSFAFKQKELQPRLLTLESDAASRGVSADNYEQLYGFMLERDAGNKLTGKYKKPSNPTKAQAEFFRFYMEEYQSAMKLLPESRRKENQLIPILKDTSELISTNGAVATLKESVSNKFTRQATDLDRGDIEKTLDENDKEFRFVPIRYTQAVGRDGDNVNPDSITLNLASSLGAFRHSAHNFHEMNKIVSELEVTKDLVGERRLIVKEGDRSVINRITKEQATSAGIDSYAYKQLDDYLTMHVYGETQADEGEFNFFGVKVDKAKLVNNLAGATAFTQLGLNVYSALNNLTVGNYTNYLETAGGQFYGARDLLSAKKEYVSLIPQLLKDYTGRFPTSKLGVLMEQLDIFQEETSTGELLKEKSFIRRAGLGASMFLTKAGEHSIQSELFMAMSKSHRIDGKKIVSYNDWVVQHNKKFDKLSKDEFNNLKTVWDSVGVEKGTISSNLPSAELTKFSERVKGVYQRLHGNYAKRDTPALNRWGIGRLVGLFRKFLKPGWDRRWAKDTFNGEDRFDQRLGSNIGGNYTITYNFLKKVASDYNKLGTFMMSENWAELPEWKKQGIKRTAAEALALSGVVLLIKALTSIQDEEEDPDWLTTMGLYQMNRLQQEILAFVNPITAMDLLRSPAASMSLFQKTGRIISQLVPGMYGAIDEESGVGRFESGENQGELKLPVYVSKVIPLYSQVERIFEPKEQLDWLTK